METPTPLYPAPITTLAQAVHDHGGRALLVGGLVRDELLGLTSQDFDLEVFGLPVRTVQELASQIGTVNEVGKAFGIFKLRVDEHEIDIALPRHDSKIGPGHRGFSIDVDPKMTPAEAAQRRDFTINAIMKDPLTGEMLDPTGGQSDLTEKVLRMVDQQTFGDDPLRVLRAFQLVARFELTVDPDTMEKLQTMVPLMKELPPERLFPEWKKLFVNARRPSLGLELAQEVGYFQHYFPVINQMNVTAQDAQYHPEGDLWTHTKLVVDKARSLAGKKELPAEDTLLIVVAAFCHDFGKVTTTKTLDGRIRSLGHEEAGAEPTQDFLKRSGFPLTIISKAVPLVANHLKPAQLYHSDQRGQWVTGGALRRLARRIQPATIEQLSIVAQADHLGRGPYPQADGTTAWPVESHSSAWLIREATERQLHAGRPEPVLYGRDLMERGWPPSPNFGEILKLAEGLADQGLTREEILGLVAEAESPDKAITVLQRVLAEKQPRPLPAKRATTVAVDVPVHLMEG